MSGVVPLGRPRDPAIDTAVLHATKALLMEVGYSRLSVEEVARRAGVSRPTIYRRWPSKPHLVHDALYDPNQARTLPDTGDFEADVRTMLRRSFASYARPEVRAGLLGLTADLQGDVELRDSVLEWLQRPVRDHLAQLLTAAISRGDVRADADPEVLFDSLFGALVSHVVVRGLDDPGFADAVADLVVRGVLTRADP